MTIIFDMYTHSKIKPDTRTVIKKLAQMIRTNCDLRRHRNALAYTCTPTYKCTDTNGYHEQ